MNGGRWTSDVNCNQEAESCLAVCVFNVITARWRWRHHTGAGGSSWVDSRSVTDEFHKTSLVKRVQKTESLPYSRTRVLGFSSVVAMGDGFSVQDDERDLLDDYNYTLDEFINETHSMYDFYKVRNERTNSCKERKKRKKEKYNEREWENTHVWIYIYVCVCSYLYIFICVYRCICVSVRILIQIYLDFRMSICIHLRAHAHTHIHTQRGKERKKRGRND